jgi:AcrR family transcriptional regulator
MKKEVGARAGRARGRPRSPETDGRILRATLRQLAEEGYSRMSVDAIAAEAGTTKPTIYRRWPGKEALAVAALEHLQAQGAPEPTGSTEADLVALLRDFRKKLLRPNGMAMIGTLLVEEGHRPALLGLFRERIVRPRRQGLLAVLRQAEGRGELRDGADLEAAVNLLVGSFYARYLTGEGIPPDWPERVVAAVLTGIRTSTAA